MQMPWLIRASRFAALLSQVTSRVSCSALRRRGRGMDPVLRSINTFRLLHARFVSSARILLRKSVAEPITHIRGAALVPESRISSN